MHEFRKCLKFKKPKSGAGFTLIELLVVIAIIGVLASIVLVALGAARAKARDAHRIADMRQWQNAMALYYDTNGSYPRYDSGTVTCSSWAENYGSYIPCWNDLKTKLSPYMSSMPQDPLDNGAGGFASGYSYAARNGNTGYILVFMPELTSTGIGQGCLGSVWYCVGVNWQ